MRPVRMGRHRSSGGWGPSDLAALPEYRATSPVHALCWPRAGTDVNPRLQIGNMCTVILLLFMNILILKQQIPENADLPLFWVGAFQAVPLACLVPAQTRSRKERVSLFVWPGGALGHPSLLEWDLRDPKGTLLSSYFEVT